MDRTAVDALMVRAQDACTVASAFRDEWCAEASRRMELQLEREEAAFRRRVLSERDSGLAADATDRRLLRGHLHRQADNPSP